MAAAVKQEFLIKILLVYLNVRGQQQRLTTVHVDNMWTTADTDESNPEREKNPRRFSSKIVILLTKDTELITGGRHFIS